MSLLLAHNRKGDRGDDALGAIRVFGGVFTKIVYDGDTVIVDLFKLSAESRVQFEAGECSFGAEDFENFGAYCAGAGAEFNYMDRIVNGSGHLVGKEF